MAVSSTQTDSRGTYYGSYAVDGIGTTRWSSSFSDPQWITVDLGASKQINRIVLNWETAYGKAYSIQVSNDNVSWTTIYSTTTGDGGVDDLAVSGTGRYVRMYGTVRGTIWGYSLYEMSVYGQ
ncbi:MAG: discoidin domain-containing protein [Pseudobdellovibrionaceae bacterium]